MRQVLAIGLISLVSLAAQGSGAPRGEPGAQEPIVLTVGSGMPGREIGFKVAYVVGVGGDLEFGEERTPFEVRGIGAHGVAIIETLEPEDRVIAEMVVSPNTEAARSSAGTGARIVLTHGITGARAPSANVR